MSSSRMRIGMVSADFTPAFGGMGRHAESLAEGLRSHADMRVYSRHDRRIRHLLGGNILFSAGIERALCAWVKKEGIGLLHLHTGPGGVLLQRRPVAVPLVVTANHTYAAQSRLPGQSWKKVFIPWERATYQAADRIICISEDTAESVMRDYGIAASRIGVIHCGFDLTPWVAADTKSGERDRTSAVFVGRRDGRKGFDLLQTAWKMVREKNQDALLHVVGFDGPAERGIVFHGRLSAAELHRLVGRSRMLIAPSRLEGFGLAAAESLAAGTPCIASDVGGLRRIVRHGVDGLLVAPDAAAFADSILTLLRDDVLWDTLHAGAEDGRNRFDLAREIDAHVALYSALYSRTG